MQKNIICGVLCASLGFLCACSGAPSQLSDADSERGLTSGDTVEITAGKKSQLFLGEVSRTGGESKGVSVMYPGNTAGVFLASVVTHALISDSVADAEARKRQEVANTVLEPLRQCIADVTVASLLMGLSSRQFDSSPLQPVRSDGAWRLAFNPVFHVSQSADAVVVTNTVRLVAADNPEHVIYDRDIRIVSRPLGEHEKMCDGESRQLVNLSHSLFAQSLDIALRDIDGFPEDYPDQTFSFYMGSEKRYERGTLLEKTCTRYIFRTLRGKLMSVPRSDLPEENCGAELAGF